MKQKTLIVILILIIFQSNFAFAKTTKIEDTKMTREEICQKNFYKLFKSKALTQTGNDPEMMEILQKYIFGEIFTIGELDIRTRELLTIVSLTTQQTLPQLKAHINAALNADVKPIEIREAIYQCAPFIGFPKTLNALEMLNEVFKERNIKTPLENTPNVKEAERYNKGLAIQQPIYGNEIKENLSALPENIGEQVSKLLTEVCFGDFYTRKYLDIKTRELLVIGILVTNNNLRVLKKHIEGNLKVGNDGRIIAAAIIQCMPYTGFPNALTALEALKDILLEKQMIDERQTKKE